MLFLSLFYSSLSMRIQEPMHEQFENEEENQLIWSVSHWLSSRFHNLISTVYIPYRPALLADAYMTTQDVAGMASYADDEAD